MYHCLSGGTDMTDSIRPAIPAEGGININALVRIPINAIVLELDMYLIIVIKYVYDT